MGVFARFFTVLYVYLYKILQKTLFLVGFLGVFMVFCMCISTFFYKIQCFSGFLLVLVCVKFFLRGINRVLL